MLTLNPWVIIEHSQCICTIWQQVIKKPSPLTSMYPRMFTTWVTMFMWVTPVSKAWDHDDIWPSKLNSFILLRLICVYHIILCYENNNSSSLKLHRSVNYGSPYISSTNILDISPHHSHQKFNYTLKSCMFPHLHHFLTAGEKIVPKFQTKFCFQWDYIDSLKPAPLYKWSHLLMGFN